MISSPLAANATTPDTNATGPPVGIEGFGEGGVFALGEQYLPLILIIVIGILAFLVVYFVLRRKARWATKRQLAYMGMINETLENQLIGTGLFSPPKTPPPEPLWHQRLCVEDVDHFPNDVPTTTPDPHLPPLAILVAGFEETAHARLDAVSRDRK